MLTQSCTEFQQPEEFVHEIAQEVDEFFHDQGYHTLWMVQDTSQQDPEDVRRAILNRLFVGYYNEVYIRDSVLLNIPYAPDVKTHQILLRQAQDENKHALWIIDLLGKRGYDPRVLGKTPSLAYSLFWDFIYGRIQRAEHTQN
ncbi:MAG: hypothetical protein K6T26_08255, partial [Alicyclobacillus sp.]|nr:hypothetical protein [Alicyclobacillus sp.]